MTMTQSFETWLTELTSDEIWMQPASMHHKPETFRTAANRVYMQCVAEGVFKPIQECRKHVYNIIVKIPGDLPRVDWTKKALAELEEKKQEEWKPVSWDKRAEYLDKVLTEINRIDDKRIRPLFDGEAEENGQYDLPKPKAKCAPSAPIEVVVEHINKVNEARRKFFLERNPDASEEEITAYISKFETI